MNSIIILTGIIFLFGLQLFIPKIKNKAVFFLFIASPLIHAIADSTTNYFEGDLTPGVIRGGIYFVAVYLVSGYVKFKGITLWIYIFLLYLGLLVPFSSNPFATLNEYTKVYISLMMFPVGYYMFDDLEKLKSLIKYSFFGASFIIIQLLVAQLFNVGNSVYLEESFYLGGALVQVTYTLVFIVIIGFVSFRPELNNDSKRFKYLIILLAIILTFIALRRISIAALIGAVCVFIFFSQHKIKFTKYIALTILVLALTFPFYGDLLMSRANYRFKNLSDFSDENRIGETLAVSSEIQDARFDQIIFGTELFNSTQHFKNNPEYYNVFGGGRQLHIDYNIILHGSGFLGFLLYMTIHFKIFAKVKNLKLSIYAKDYKAVAFSLLFLLIFFPFSGSISGVGFRSILFIFLGSIISVTKNFNNSFE